MTALNPKVRATLVAIEKRSAESRARYLTLMDRQRKDGPARTGLSCGNLAHAFAASGGDKGALAGAKWPNLAILTAYNDMLSAHQPYGTYPDLLKAAARKAGATAQVAGGVPAMCDGVTQGRAGMDLSLFSRDVIALSAAVALSHDAFDGGLLLGVCDKIVPGLLIGALRFGHLPFVFVPAGPMPSGLPNKDKARVRQAFAEGKATRTELLEAEAASYHAPGTCTFYGTANTNQLLLEVMGLMLPGAAFVNPGTPLRAALTAAAAEHAAGITALGAAYRPLSRIVDARGLVNAIVALLASGGSTNHVMHLIAIARAAGLHVTLEDFDVLSRVVPLLVRVYPNGEADVNHFRAAGGTPFLVRSLLNAGLLIEECETILGNGLQPYTDEPWIDGGALAFRAGAAASADRSVLRGADAPFSADGGLKLVAGALGRAIVKVSAVSPAHQRIEAAALVFEEQADVIAAFEDGRLSRDVVVVLRGQGPRARGMPELHKLTPALGVLQDRGHKVALITDGRMSGASGKVLAAIHVTPEAAAGGALARVRDGDRLLVDAPAGRLDILGANDFEDRPPAPVRAEAAQQGLGRELFALMRGHVSDADDGASIFAGL